MSRRQPKKDSRRKKKERRKKGHDPLSSQRKRKPKHAFPILPGEAVLHARHSQHPSREEKAPLPSTEQKKRWEALRS